MIDDYLKAKHYGDRAYKRAVQAGEYPYLPALDDILSYQDVAGEVQLGLKEVPLYMIAGTKTAGRQNAFALNFMPLMKDKSEFAAKWIALYDSQLEVGLRDPIIVYEFMNQFYVLEGNKRVSVMKFMGAASIPAYVTRILPKRTEEKENKIYYEYVDFYKVTGIFRITFSEEGCYKKLAAVLGQNLTEAWPEELCNDVKATFVRFSEAYEARGGGKLRLTYGDAYLVYLSVYGLKGLLDISSEEIDRRIGRIWNEFLTEMNEEKIALVETPELIKKPASMIDFLNIPSMYTVKNPLKIAFIYDRNADHSSWVYGHEIGRNQMEEHFKGVVETIRFEDCDSSAEVMNAIDLAVAAGNQMIFTTTAAQLEPALRAAIKYPEVKILNCSVNASYSSVRTYYGRMYEAKFLLGALAASMTEGDQIGYVADYPVYGMIANINAFAIGAALVNPRVKIHLKWSTKKGTDWNRELAEAGISCISGPDWIRPQEASRAFGLYQLGKDGDVANLAMPMWHWGKYYELIVGSVLEGSWEAKDLTRKHQALNYWWGMSADVIEVILSGQLPYYSRKFIDILKKEVIAGDLSPFDGELRSQTAVIKKADAPRLTNEEIISMDWLNDNVIGEIPSLEELTEKAQEIVRVSGVKEA